MKKITRGEFLLYSAGAAAAAAGAWLAKDILDFQKCVDEGIEVSKKMYGTKKLPDYVANEVKRSCGLGRERR